jgi:hypothetical protein
MIRSDLATLVENMDEFVFIPNGVDLITRTVLQAALLGQLADRSSSGPTGLDLAEELDATVLEREDRPELPDSWAYVSLTDAAEVRLGRQRSPGRATGERMRPYLRAANASGQGLKLDDVKSMAFTEIESETFQLKPGDLLLSEASGSPKEVGKPAQFRGEIDECCFQNTLIRVRMEEPLNADYYEWYFRHQALSGAFIDSSRGIGIQHLGAKRLSTWIVPIAPLDEQAKIVTLIEALMAKVVKLRSALSATGLAAPAVDSDATNVA